MADVSLQLSRGSIVISNVSSGDRALGSSLDEPFYMKKFNGIGES